MNRLAVTSLLFVSGVACADCGLSISQGTMTLVVGKNTKKCFSSPAFTQAFRANIEDALSNNQVAEASPSSSPNRKKKAFDERNSNSEKLWALEERAFQARVPTGRYFGQRP